jgi:hypothetical protein
MNVPYRHGVSHSAVTLDRPRRITRGLFTGAFLALVLGAVAGSSSACVGPLSPANVTKVALDVAQYACIIANADLPNVPAVETACQLDQTLGPAIEAVLADFGKASDKRVAAQLAARNCK